MASVAEHTREDRPHVYFTSDPRSDALIEDGTADETETPRGRLKRRRMSSHSPPRAPSPSRGHERASGSRHRHHHRKHHRASSSSSISPPPAMKKNRRRSDAEPDHTLRGRARRSRSPIIEGEEREVRKRSQPPSRHRVRGEEDGDEGALRRQRSFPNLYREAGKEEKVKEGKKVDSGAEDMEGVRKGDVYEEERQQGDVAPAVQKV